MRGEGNVTQIQVLDGSALRALSTELNSSKYAIDAHNRSINELGNLSEFPKLCSLDVSFNKITSLRNVSTARELRELKIYNNKLTNTIGLKANSNLEGLVMNDNQIEDISSDFLALSRLKKLGLNGNQIMTVQNLCSCRALMHLDLGRNRLQGAASEGLEALTNLEHLNLTGNQIASVGNLAHLTKLEELNLSDNKLSTLQGVLPPNLIILRINGNQITDFNGLVTPLAKLNELYAQDNTIADLEILPSRCPQLESLDLRNNQIATHSHIAALSRCDLLQDIWLQGNPCCYSSSYLIDVAAAFPGLKTLDMFTDSQLHSHLEKLKNGAISQDELLSSARATTPYFRPGSATSRPGSAFGNRLLTPSGRPVTPDSAPVFHTPSARMGNLIKLANPSELAKAEEEVLGRLQKIKQLLHRVGTSTEENTPADTKVNADLRRTTKRHISDDLPPTATTFKKSDSRNKVRAQTNGESGATNIASAAQIPPHPTSSKQNETKRPPKLVSRVRTVQSLIRRSCVDAGTDPLDSLMGNNNNQIETPRSILHDCETETQTVLPPVPLSVSKSNSILRDSYPKLPELPLDNQPQHTGESIVMTKETGTEADNNETPWELERDGDLIEAEMKLFLLQNATDSSLASNNQDRLEEHPEDDIDPAKFWSDSPRLDPIKTAEQRKPPTSLSVTGYRTFRMPSRPSTAEVI